MSRALTRSVLCAALAGTGLFNSLNVVAEDLPTVVVSATRSEQSTVTTPASISVINKEEIQASGATTISDVLRGRGGIQLADLFGDGSSVSVGIRGFAENANSNTLVMVDGRRLNYSDTRAPDLSYIALQDVERIEIVKGSAGVLFGDQAVGGVINIITRKPEKSFSRAELEAGSYSRAGGGLYHSNVQDNGVNYKLSISGYDTDNYREHNEHSNVNVSAYAGYDYQSGSVFLELQRVEDDLQTPGALIYSEMQADRQQINSGFINDFTNTDTDVQRLGVQHNLSGNWSLEAELTNREIDQDVRQSFRDFPAPETGESSRDLVSINPRLIGSLPVQHGDMLITLGVDRENSEYALRLPYDSAFGPGQVQQANDQDVTSIYAQLVYPLSKKLSLTTGVRNAEMDTEISDTSSYNFTPLALNVDDSVTVAEIGMRYRLSDNAAFVLRRDENYRFAKINEFTLVTPGDVLKTQQGVSWEAGYQAQYTSFAYELQLYHMTLENEFFFDPTVGLYGANVNLDETIHQGLVLDYRHELGRASYVGINYTYTDAQFNSGGLDGNSISGIADNQLALRSGYGWDENWNLYVELVAIGDRYAQGDNTNTLAKESGYGVVNSSLSYRTKTYDVVLRVNNLFDKEYAEYVVDNGYLRAFQPSPERNFVITAGMKF